MRAVVVLQVTLIFIGADLHGLAEVARLEARFKLKGAVDGQTHLIVAFSLGVIETIVGLKLFVVAIQPRSGKSLPLLCDLGLWQPRLSAKAVGLLQIVGEVVRVEVVLFGVGLFDGPTRLVIG